MSRRDIAERIAANTWERLGTSRRLHTRLGEETLTDLLVLDFLSSVSPSEVRVVQTTKLQEASQGTDLVVYVRQDTQTADIYAVQAKKLSDEGRYAHLNPWAGQTQRLQIDVLEQYAQQLRAIPLYLLFNHVVGQNVAAPSWHCCQQPPDTRQFGCTLVPSWCIRNAISMRGGRTFEYVHTDPAALPWRCAFDCPNNRMAWSRIREKAKESHRQRFPTRFPSFDKAGPELDRHHSQYADIDFRSGVGEWPYDVWDRGTSPLSVEDTTRLCGARIFGSLFFPRWLVLVNSNDRS